VPRNSWPIVVGGCYRSGTSLVRRLLNAHPRIHCGPEVTFFRDFFGAYLNDPIHHARFTTTARSILPEAELLTILGRAFVALHERAAALAEKPRWADKTPDNILFLNEWHKLLGERWLFVHVVRNPLDVLASIKEAVFPWTIPPQLEARIELYCRCLSAGIDFGALYPDRCYRVFYEKIVQSPESTLSDLMAWLGEEPEPGQLLFNDRPQQAGLEDPKIAGTTGIHRASFHRWHTILAAEEAETIWQSTRELWALVDPRGENLATGIPAVEPSGARAPRPSASG
jgi:hypothetical protein